MISTFFTWLESPPRERLQGGIALKRNKPGLPTNGSIRSLETPSILRIPLLNYQRDVLEPLVTLGQDVQFAEALAPGVITSSAGTVIDIATHAIAHPSKMTAPCVVIQTRPENTDRYSKTHPELEAITIKRIRECCIQGLGGAGYDTSMKMERPSKSELRIDTLIINAVECEPLISCDESVLITESETIVKAIQRLTTFTSCRQCLLAIEDDKPQALAALEKAISLYDGDLNFVVKRLPPIYPSGAERPLVERLTQQVIPRSSYPADLGIVCTNVSTVLAIEYARQGYPMVSRVVTIAGELAVNPVNVHVRFGTSVSEVLKQTGNDKNIKMTNVRIGGPLSGFTIDDLSIPVTATTNSITLELEKKPKTQLACIRCSACSDVCPVKLLPQQLYQLSTNANSKKAETSGVTTCIECGCCDLVCPSNIPLTQSFRFLKGVVKEQHRQNALANVSELRFAKREKRQLERSDQKVKLREAAKQQLATEETSIADALERAKQRRKKRPAKRQPTNIAKNNGLDSSDESTSS